MTRAELVEWVHRRHGGLSLRETRHLVDVILRVLTVRLGHGERIEIPQLGTFEVSEARPRKGRHPVTRRPFRVDARRHLVFRPSRSLRESVNEAGA
jgi:nucleoid DNA-binding protein